VIRSSAIPDDNVELRAARKAGLAVVGRGELLAEVMRTREGIAIGGSHGKTTTSAMVSHLLESAGLDPTALIGGRVPRAGGYSSPTRLGESEFLVAEVDESDGSFLLTRPVIAVLTNADPEHLDHYGNREALLDAFVEFANCVPFWGAVVLGIDHPGILEIAPRIRSRSIRFGLSASADLRAESIDLAEGKQRCRASLKGQEAFEFSISLPGTHNILNALAAIAVGLELDIPRSLLIDGLATFPGVARRYERTGSARGVDIVDDYAHHPAEISATLAAARSLNQGRIVAIFQPHRFTRTRDCWTDFLDCFGMADCVLISEIYAASESPIAGIDAASLASAINASGHPDARFGGSLATLAETLPGELSSGDLVLTLGAGDIAGLGSRLLENLGRDAGGRA
jgi:UDP-N-acetylmuramate--alanine ligase